MHFLTVTYSPAARAGGRNRRPRSVPLLHAFLRPESGQPEPAGPRTGAGGTAVRPIPAASPGVRFPHPGTLPKGYLRIEPD